MKRLALLFLAVLAGCYQPRYPSETPGEHYDRSAAERQPANPPPANTPPGGSPVIPGTGR